MSWHAAPFTTAQHDSLGYMAASRVNFRSSHACCPPLGLEQSPPDHLHCSSSALKTIGGLLMKPVGFFTGSSFLGPRVTSGPYWHWSLLTRPTPGVVCNSAMAPCCQDVAWPGCSCKNYLPPSMCSMYSETTNSKCDLASAFSSE